MLTAVLRTGLVMASIMGCAGAPAVAPASAQGAVSEAEGAASKAGSPSPLPALVDALLVPPGRPRGTLSIVFVLDGLRPDSINPVVTPNLARLRAEGVSFAASHSVFPTVTRVNAASIATGNYPARHGIIGNTIFVPAVDAAAPFSSGDYLKLRELERASGGQLLLTRSLGELLAESGKKLAVVSSSGNGCAYLLNHRARDGVGVLINGLLEPGKVVALPSALNDTVLQRFGPSPTREGLGAGAVDWAGRVLTEYVLPELGPDVVLNWITQPDSAQHTHGPGSAEGVAAIANADRNVGLVLEKLRALGRYETTNVFVLSDHGFALNDFAVDLGDSLVKAGLKASATSDDVVIASSQTLKLHVKGHDRHQIRAIVEHLQRQPWTDAIFTHAAEGGAAPSELGFVDGTFSLGLIHHDSAARGADILVSFAWTSDVTPHGLRGVSTRDAFDGVAGPVKEGSSGHGSMSPWDVRNTWFAWGADIKRGATSPVPVANVDLAPSVLALSGVRVADLDGRIVAEAFEGGPDVEKVPFETRSLLVENATTGYRAALSVSDVGRHRYIDKSWRVSTGTAAAPAPARRDPSAR